jgi:hypothetical protein
MASDMAECFDVPMERVMAPPAPEVVCNKCADMDELITALKEKVTVSTSQEKLKLLTLTPSSWKIEKTAKEFDVSVYMVKKSRSLKKTGGILADPPRKKGKELSQEVKDRVVEFYEDDQYSRMCPGQKEYVSVKRYRNRKDCC